LRQALGHFLLSVVTRADFSFPSQAE
jgi:hypothetical protein